MKRKGHHEATGIWGFLIQYWRQLMRYMATGLLVWIPLIMTVWVSWFFVKRFVLGVEYLIQDFIVSLNGYGQNYPLLSFFEHIYYFPGMGALVVIALFLTTGFLTRFLVGRRVIDMGERIVQQIPLISRVYRSVRQIRDTFVGRQGAVFQNVCLIEYPRAGMIAVAFVTSKEQGLVQEVRGAEMVAVFVPTTPNPTSGYLVYLPPEDVTVIDISVEEAMKLIVSAGAYIPGTQVEGISAVENGADDAQPRAGGRGAAIQGGD
jgi:uncharacterized membrane protein